MSEIEKQIQYWHEAAKRDLDTAESLFRLKRYDSSLFFCHLSLEKLLKGLVLKKTQKAPPYIHDLERLAVIADIQLTNQQIKQLKIITEFNIVGRYHDAKFSFYKKCTKQYTVKHIAIVKKLYLWIKKQYQFK